MNSALLGLYCGASANTVKNLEKCQIFYTFWVYNKLLALQYFVFDS